MNSFKKLLSVFVYCTIVLTALFSLTMLSCARYSSIQRRIYP